MADTHTVEDENEYKLEEFGKSESVRSDLSMASIASSVNSADGRYENLGPFRDILATENDLAGFSIAWFAGFVIITVLRIMGHEDVQSAHWWWIFLIPLIICSLTWVFSYVITKYRKPNSIESMRIPAFILPFICKIAIAALVFWRLFHSSGGIKDRNMNKDGYNGWCECCMFMIWLCLLLSAITTEIIITTVMVNSSQNLVSTIPKKVDIFLFITRPLLWVYNRLIVMFLVFYCYYYVFGIGPLSTSQCKVQDVSNVSSIGVSILILPFRTPLYLFKWKSFDLTQYSDSKDVVYAVIQQFLIFTTILDLLMDIWSISQIGKRLEPETLRRLSSSIRGHKYAKDRKNSKPHETMPPIHEVTEIDDGIAIVTKPDECIIANLENDLEKLISTASLKKGDDEQNLESGEKTTQPE